MFTLLTLLGGFALFLALAFGSEAERFWSLTFFKELSMGVGLFVFPPFLIAFFFVNRAAVLTEIARKDADMMER